MYYFASDIHLGLDYPGSPAREREERFLRWLELAGSNARAIFLVGDVFDFWYEYKYVVPKGFTRVLAKISELTAQGIEVHFFAGNHDLWQRDYFHKECGMVLHSDGQEFRLSGKNVYVAHGDVLIPARSPFKRLMNWMFRSRVTRWLFSNIVHPDLAMRIGHGWSRHSRVNRAITHAFKGEREATVKFARKYLKTHKTDYFIMGHYHCTARYALEGGSEVVMLGEWIHHPSYATLDDKGELIQHFFEAI